jgi:hypothetical protein
MARTPRSGRVTLNVKVQFEPNRLSEQCLATAYEVALPLVSQKVVDKKKRQYVHDNDDTETRLAVKNG